VKRRKKEENTRMTEEEACCIRDRARKHFGKRFKVTADNTLKAQEIIKGMEKELRHTAENWVERVLPPSCGEISDLIEIHFWELGFETVSGYRGRDYVVKVDVLS
jgi:hypothetical protein